MTGDCHVRDLWEPGGEIPRPPDCVLLPVQGASVAVGGAAPDALGCGCPGCQTRVP